MKYLGFIFMVLAIYFFIKSIQKSKMINSDSSIKLTGVVVDNKIGTVGNGGITYYPVYEYELNNETKRYTSECVQFQPSQIGTKIFLYYNKPEGKIIEAVTPVAQMSISVAFALSAMILTLITN